MIPAAGLPPGFHLYRGWFTLCGFDAIREAITWQQQTIRAYGREVAQPRLTSWMGDAPYTYSGRRHDPAPLPGPVEYVRRQVQETTGETFNSVLANLYRDGSDSVAWHADDEPELGASPTIASLSLGATRAFHVKLRAGGAPWKLDLAHGDLLVMMGASQRDYLHSVPKRANAGARINLTFRQIWV